MEQSVIAAFTRAFAWRNQKAANKENCPTNLFDGAYSDIKVVPGRLEFATPEESNNSYSIRVDSLPLSPCRGWFIIDLCSRDALDDIAEPPDLFLDERNIWQNQESLGSPVLNDFLEHEDVGNERFTGAGWRAVNQILLALQKTWT